MWQQAKEGDKKAWQALIDTYGNRVRNLVWPLVPRSDIDDVCQEVWLSVHNGLSRFRGDSEFATWLHAIAINTARNWHNNNVKRRPTTSPMDDDHQEAPAVVEIDNSGFEDAIKHLTEEDRAIFRLYYIYGYTQQEIADHLGWRSSKTVNSRLSRGRATIKPHLGNPRCPG